MKKFISVVLAALMLVSAFAISVSAEAGNVSVRIEGAQKNIFEGEVSLDITDETTVADVLTALVAEDDTIKITGIDTGYITEINGEKADQFSKPDDYIYDGWQYAVNGEAPSVGISGMNVAEGDEIVLFYGDYPSQVPVMDTDKLEQGVLTFESYDYVNGYMDDESGEWISEYDWCPVVGATVTLNTDSYTTDENGAISFDLSKYEEFVTVQISRISVNGAPNVCRFGSDFGFDVTSDEPGSEEVTTEPATTEPATTEPVTTEPATTEPATTEPATTEPVTTEPVTTEPVTTEPATTEPATTEPVTTEPATTEPATTEPATTEPATTEPVTTEPATVYVTPSATFTFEKEVFVTDTFKINFTSDNKVKFTTNKKTVARVNSKGVVRGVKAGKAIITASVGKFKVRYIVTVKNPILNAAKKVLKRGKSFNLKVTGVIGNVRFTSAKKNIATVSSNGKVTAKKKGTAVIKVTANGVTLKCKIIVR